MNRTMIVVLLAAAGPAEAQVTGPEVPVTYRLGVESSWQEGCFEPCACPITIASLTGTFELTPIELTGTLDTYAISNLTWSIGVPGTSTFWPVTGHGTYTIFQEVAVQHAMTLELGIAGAPPRVFDTDLVVTSGQFPEIDILVSEGDLVCFDTVFVIDASPLPTCLSDTDGDGVTGIDDLMNVLLDWGSNGLGHGGDADGNGWVDVDDLLAVITAWGPCG